MNKTLYYLLAFYLVATLAVCFAKYRDEASKNVIRLDPIYAQAVVTNVSENMRRKKGLDVSQYRITYSYSVNDKNHSGVITGTTSGELPHKKEDTIDIYYKQSNPSVSVLKANLGEALDTWGWIKLYLEIALKMIPFSLMVFVLALVVVNWFRPAKQPDAHG